MEVRVKTGKDLKCEYTDQECSALIKIYSHDENKETAWIGKEALANALQILDSVTGTAKPSFHYPPGVREPEFEAPDMRLRDFEEERSIPSVLPPTTMVQPPPNPVKKKEPVVRFPGRNPKDPPELVQQFEVALVELVENPPKTRENETEGLAETAVRSLIKQFKTSFRNTNAMFTPLRKHLGMTKERFDTIMDGL